jgi:hypothetical protein
MRAVMEVSRDPDGRLTGQVSCAKSNPRSFLGIIELVGILENALEEISIDEGTSMQDGQANETGSR